MKRTLFLLLFLSTLTFNLEAKVDVPPLQPDEWAVNFRLMQFNILQSTSETAGYEWEKRKAGVYQMIAEHDPDLICLQEARKTQCNDLATQFPGYLQLKHPKDDIESNGGQRDLFMYKASKFELVSWEKFWFSETPYSSSYSWDADTPKLTIAAKFRYIGEGKTKTLWVYNTHFFPRGDSCRQICSNMMVDHILKNTKPDEVVLLCGDLNLNWDDTRLDTLRTILNDAADAPDTDGKQKVTYNGFRDGNTKTLDHIFGRNVNFKTYRVEASTEKYGIKWISDHFPLYTDLQIPLEHIDSVAYSEVNGMKLENKWLRVGYDPYCNTNLSLTKDQSRGFAVKDNIVYVCGRKSNTSTSACYLNRYDATTGVAMESVTLPTDINCSTYPCNDIITDDAGNLIISNYALTVSSQPLKLYLYNPSDNTVKLVAERKSSSGTARMDHCAVKGNVAEGNFTVWIMASNSNKLIQVNYKNGAFVDEVCTTIGSFSPSSLAKVGVSSRIFPLADGDQFVVNSATTYPSLYSLSSKNIVSAFAGDTPASPTSADGLFTNGFNAFTLKGINYMVYPMTDNTGANGFTFTLAQTDGVADFSTALPLFNFPKEGVGDVKNTNAESLVLTELNATEDTAFIYVFVPGNGLAKYAFSGDNISGIHSPNVEKLPIQQTKTRILLNEEADKVTIYNISGQQVASYTKVKAISKRNLPLGTYIVKVSKGGKEIATKITF